MAEAKGCVKLNVKCCELVVIPTGLDFGGSLAVDARATAERGHGVAAGTTLKKLDLKLLGAFSFHLLKRGSQPFPLACTQDCSFQFNVSSKFHFYTISF